MWNIVTVISLYTQTIIQNYCCWLLNTVHTRYSVLNLSFLPEENDDEKCSTHFFYPTITLQQNIARTMSTVRKILIPESICNIIIYFKKKKCLWFDSNLLKTNVKRFTHFWLTGQLWIVLEFVISTLFYLAQLI